MVHRIVIRSLQSLSIIIGAIDWKKIILGRVWSGWNQVRIGPILMKVKRFCFRYDFQYWRFDFKYWLFGRSLSREAFSCLWLLGFACEGNVLLIVPEMCGVRFAFWGVFCSWVRWRGVGCRRGSSSRRGSCCCRVGVLEEVGCCACCIMWRNVVIYFCFVVTFINKERIGRWIWGGVPDCFCRFLFDKINFLFGWVEEGIEIYWWVVLMSTLDVEWWFYYWIQYWTKC